MTIKSIANKKIAIAWMAMAVTAGVVAAPTDLANAPLVTSSASSVLPNVFLMMDDSGSMNWDYMPDDVSDFGKSSYGYASSQCNGVYYNPAITYLPPVNSDGTSYPNASFTNAWMDGFKTSLGKVDLSTKFALGQYQSYSAPTSGTAAYYYQYSGSQTTAKQKNYYDTSSTFYKECNTTAAANPTATITVSGSASTSVTSITVGGKNILSGTASGASSSTLASDIKSKITAAGYSATVSGSTVTITGPAAAAAVMPVISKSGGMTLTPSAFTPFAKVIVSATSGPGGTDERQNFANWFSYYRTRINMMKTGTGAAFKPLDSNYRVGFATMNNNGGSKFLNLATFDATQKSKWYDMLYSTSANNSTPLLMALSNAGLMYANRLPKNILNDVAANDPIQYSCQQNFTILSTDGFWNSTTISDLYGKSVGNQDGDKDRPYNDGQIAIITAKTPTYTVVRKQTDTPKTVTTKWTRTWSTTAATKGTGSCKSNQYLVTSQSQIYNQVQQQIVTSIDDTTTTVVRTVVTSDGIVTSDTTSAPSNSTANVSTSTTISSDTGDPATATAWANSGSASTSCSASPSPAPGTSGVTSAPKASAPSTVTGSATVTQLSSTGPTTGATTTTTTNSGGISNTLADVAMYYYNTDLRTNDLKNCTGALGTGVDVCENNVPKTNQDTASWQHMTTFTLGLGAYGRMVYSPTYQTDTSGDYVSVKNGDLADPANGVCSWGTAGQKCNWPTPNSAGTPENIDDLWHAAVNGRGAYFSATNPTTLAAGLSNALSGIAARTGASAAATTSNPNVTTGDNFLFSSTFNTSIWDGNIIRQQINLSTGALSSTIDWSAQAQLDANPARTLYTYDSTNTSHIKPFAWNSLNATEQGYFALSNLTSLSQFCATGAYCLSATDQAAAAGANLVAYLAGDRTNEGTLLDSSTYYRLRSTANNPHPNAVIGDIVNGEAVYVKSPLYKYSDSGYSDFIAANANRAGRVYVPSNDGMLHAFDAATGDERWAYIPSFVLPNLYKLADKNYANKHQYFVDGTPVSGDVYYDGAWHTILVGGLNGGGRGYYAIDITDPSVAPKVLWEFSNDNLGYSYGNPVITKLADGTWVVLVASGYNNVSPGDGKGYLFVLNAKNGNIIRTISTDVGDTSNPSGLAKISAYSTNAQFDNTSLRAYGGDLQGNLWRFDINAGTKQLLVTLKDGTGGSAKAQPITTKPELGDYAGIHMVLIGTGKYLGVSDLADTSVQSYYGIKDTLATSAGAIYSDSRTGFIQQTQTTTTCPPGASTSVCSTGEVVRISSNNTVNLSVNNGWYIDFPDSGERVNTDPTLALGTLFFTTNVPNATACTTGGYSFLYQVDYRTGSAIQNSKSVAAVKIDNTLATRPVPVSLPNNTVVVYVRKSDGTTSTDSGRINNSSTAVRRVSWRELNDD